MKSTLLTQSVVHISLAYYVLYAHAGLKMNIEIHNLSTALACHHFKCSRFLFSHPDLHTSLVTLSLSLLSKATNIRGKANMGQGQSLALTEHKCITSGLNYQGITRCVALCHCASHNSSNRWKMYSEERNKMSLCQFAQ